MFQNNSGKITTITGNMFGGKTTELINRVNQMKRDALSQNKSLSFCCFKHQVDDRYDATKIVTHDGVSIDAYAVNSIEKMDAVILEKNPDVVVIDEVQFFMETAFNQYIIVDFLRELSKSREVILSGLSKDFRGMPFGPIGEILAISDEIVTKHSKCAICGDEATMSQRLVNDFPASWNQETVVVGAASENDNCEHYEPRCRKCHVVVGEPKLEFSSQK